MGDCLQWAVSGPDSAGRRIPRLARATGVLPPSPKGFGGLRFSDEAGKGRADERPPPGTAVVEERASPELHESPRRCGSLAPEDPVEQAVTDTKNVAEACDGAWGWTSHPLSSVHRNDGRVTMSGVEGLSVLK